MSRHLSRFTYVILTIAVVMLLSAASDSMDAFAQQGSPPGEPPTELTDQPVMPGTARAAKIEALQIVGDMEQPYPDSYTDRRQEHAYLYLSGSVDGTYRSDNFLKENVGARAFEYDSNAAKILQEIAADPKATLQSREDAQRALDKLIESNRKVTTEVLAATDIFGEAKPQAAKDNITKARQEISAGDAKVSQNRETSAVGNYRRAWQYTVSAVNLCWKAVNPGGEKLLPEMEQKLGTDVNKADTDGDGLTDEQELTRTGSDPTKADPAGTDSDSDGLSDVIEIQKGTDPLEKDTDGEGLTDGFEAGAFNSDPTKQDTDGDGLTDDSESRLGSNPRKADSDGNGEWDGFQNYTTKKSTEDGSVSVEMTGRGDVARSVQFQTVDQDKVYESTPGRVSGAVDITLGQQSDFDDPFGGEFTNARVKIEFDPSLIPNGDYENLSMMYWDEEAKVFVPLDNQGVNASEGYAWADTSHFTTFLLVHEPTWYAEWRKKMGVDFGRDPDDPDFRPLDVALVLDSSGSMSWNDPRGLRVDAAKGFINALYDVDRTAVIDFDGYASLYQSLTSNRTAARAAVDRIDSDGGTNIGAGVQVANQELISNGDASRGKVMVVLTDGVGSYDPSLTDQAKDADITIFTVGLGSDVDEGLLRSIAEETGGVYYPISSADQLPDLFERIARQNPDPDNGPDTDGDGLSDDLEIGGFRAGNGEFVTTKPDDEDTDDDGFTDGEEAGEYAVGPDGDYFQVSTDPTEADPDEDGIDDFDEVGIGTSPNNADSDYDDLDDPVELAENFDPNEPNADNDDLRDDEELSRGFDPFHSDRTGYLYGKDGVTGWIYGGLGRTSADLGVINHDTLRSLGYLDGWTSNRGLGNFSLDDFRDAIGVVLDGTEKSGLSIILENLPASTMHGEGFADDIGTFATWHPDQQVDIARWVATTPKVRAYTWQSEQTGNQINLMSRALDKVGWEDMGLDYLSSEEALDVRQELAASRNDPDELRGYLAGRGGEVASSASENQFAAHRGELDTVFLSNDTPFTQDMVFAQSLGDEGNRAASVFGFKFDRNGSTWANIEDRVNNLWNQQKLNAGSEASVARKKAEARAVEAAVEVLEDEGYDLLYVGRNTPLEMIEPYTKGEAAPDKYLLKGPDIVAVDPYGKPLIVEVKGSKDFLSLTSSLVRSVVGNKKLTQASLDWLRTNAASRYLNTMNDAQDPRIRRAANLIEQIIDPNQSNQIAYDAAWVGYGEKGSTLGKVTGSGGALEQLAPDPLADSGVNEWNVYTIEAQ